MAMGLPRRVRQPVDSSRRCIRVVADSGRWLEAFPQHGPGRKHDRKIELASWQREIVDRHPRVFLRGLLHSDGCRTVNRFKTKLPSRRVVEYAYPRWFFSNRQRRGCRARSRAARRAGRGRRRHDRPPRGR
jgi:hypothetical protein